MSARPVLGRGLELKIMMRTRSERWHPSDRRRKSFGFGVPGTIVLPDSELFTQFRFIKYGESPFHVKKEHYLAVEGGLSQGWRPRGLLTDPRCGSTT